MCGCLIQKKLLLALCLQMQPECSFSGKKNTLMPTKRLLNADDGSQSSKVQVHKRARKREKCSLKAPLVNLQTYKVVNFEFAAQTEYLRACKCICQTL